MTPTPKSWEVEFDEIWGRPRFDIFTKKMWEEGGGKIKSFISNLLSTRAQEIRGMMKMESDYDDEDKRARRDVRPFNEALEEAAQVLEQ